MSSTTTMPTYAAGTLVHARGRDWVVLPESDDQMLVLRPLGGGIDDTAAVIPALEKVLPAAFLPPDPSDIGDDRSARLLRDALRIGFRSTGGPFRSLGSLSVTPRPYQLVPLLLALRQETVRLLIADDVGIGKTVEAGLVAAELLAQGSARGLSVLCPPSLATQWTAELEQKFGMQPQLVLPGTVRRLERGLSYGESIFERHPVTVVSTDFIKGERRRDEFLRSAPDLVIVDEAHSSVNDDTGAGGSGRTQRYRLVRDLAVRADRHLILVTATPHSGNDGAFRNLIALLDEDLKTADLGTESGRRALAAHMVQRRRADIRSYLQQDTKFPSDRQVLELAYTLSARHRGLFDDVLAYVRGQVQDQSGTRLQQRVRWWSALSLLRSAASSPAAAAATLETRAAASQADDVRAADRLGSAEVLDQAEDDALDSADATPGAITVDETGSAARRRLRQMQEAAERLAADWQDDAKLALLIRHVRALIKDGFHPIVFCRFIRTAHYVTGALRSALPRGVEVEVVTGELAAEERSGRVSELALRAGDGPKVLVATDCLSEGVNLQEDYQAVVHYDLAWNPTRHEQREGRVDRFGQPADVVRATLIYGEDNGIDGIVLDVLLRKHEAIRKALGISVPVPPQSDQVLAALLEGVLLRGGQGELQLDFGAQSTAARLDEEWRSTAEAERASRSRFAQASIHPDEVQAALEAGELDRPVLVVA
ncbi:MAG: helicase-related protein, partial [Micrococcales bacterium]|nr:helicase-related protein [Micrococcales bacterium]